MHKCVDNIISNNGTIDELRRNWEEHGVFRYWVMDDTFNDTNYKLEAVAEAKEKSGVPLDLTVFLRLDLQHRLKQTEMIKSCGIKSIYYGIETLNPESAIAIGKGWHPDEQMAFIRDLSSFLEIATAECHLVHRSTM